MNTDNMKKTDDDVRIQISNNIKLLLKSEKITRRQVCTDLGFKYTTFCDWVNGKTTPGYRALEQLGDYFKVEPWWFYGDVAESKKQRASALLQYASVFNEGKILDMNILNSLTDDQVNELLASGFTFRHKSFKERLEDNDGVCDIHPFNWNSIEKRAFIS